MENNGEGGDDQSSGWLEVKKKHRTSSKFSSQSFVGGFSSKCTANFLRNQPSTKEKSRNTHARRISQPSKAEVHFSIQVQRGDGDSTSVLNNAERAIVNQDTEPPKLTSVAPIHIADSNGETADDKETDSKEKINIIPKIKWGDLEDDALVMHNESMTKTEIKFGDIDDDNFLFCKKSGNTNESVPSNPSCTVPQEDESVIYHADTDRDPDKMLSSASKDVYFEENCEETDGISLKDMETLHEHVIPINNDTVDGLGSCSHSNGNNLSLATAEVGTRTPHISDNKSDVGDLDLSSVEHMIDEDSSMNMVAQDSVFLSPQRDVSTDVVAQNSVSLSPQRDVSDATDNFLNASITDSVEVSRGSQDDKIHIELSKAQIMSAFGENELGESKERFRQRLWCFLFENLNRAVDELYLLCELECDVEQMKEAILVLEEAASDFKELNSRVEEFEKMKWSSIEPSIDGMPLTVKADHRRPHALSWEVRRMTNSPHRAEILSSSLEVFKKIQQERANLRPAHCSLTLATGHPNSHHNYNNPTKSGRNNEIPSTRESVTKSRKQSVISDVIQGKLIGEKRNAEAGRSTKVSLLQNGHLPSQALPSPNLNAAQLYSKDGSATSVAGRSKRENLGSVSEMENQVPKRDKILTESRAEKNFKSLDSLRKQIPLSDKDKEKEKRITASLKSMDAWKEKRNWQDILASPLRGYTRVSQSSGMSRKSVERARVLHDKLMSPEKKKKTALDLKKEAEEKHARAMRIRSELENERVQRLQRTSEKLNRVNEWQAIRSMKLREGMHARHQRSESRHEAFLAQVVRRAGDESSKVNEVRFITSLNEENKKLILRQKLHDSELRRAEKLQVMKTKQKEDMAREEAVVERRKLLEAEKLQRLAETQRKKEEAQLRREEDRKASSAAREAKAVEQLRRKEVRAKAQQEEAELLAQKLAEKLNESEQRRKFYLEQIRERASMDFRDQSSPLLRRSSNKEGQVRSITNNSTDDDQENIISGLGGSALGTGNTTLQNSLKRRIKRIRQKLMALKFEFPEPPIGVESTGIGNRTVVGTARAKIGRWLHELQKLRQARKEGAASIGLIIGDMMKFLEGKHPELHASRQAGLLDFIASALPASHTSKPEACQVTLYFLRLLKVLLSLPANRSYFLAQNLLPPIIPMLSAALENYIKIAASLNIPGNTNIMSSKTSVENMESVSEVLEGFLFIVTTIICHNSYDVRQVQMQEGLLELVIAYQVIHRLRDLFALYDRPQAEGSPFPSSIMLSLNLLAVLTSGSRTISSIAWGSFPFAPQGDETHEVKPAESADIGPSVNIASEDNLSSLPVRNFSIDESLPGVPEERELDEPCVITGRDSSLSRAMDPEKELVDVTGELSNSASPLQLCVTDASDEPQNHLLDGHGKDPVPQKIEKNSIDICGEQKKKILKQPIASLLSAIAETGLVSLLSLLTAVLLQASNRLPSEQASYVLPSNFEEVATGVLKVLNNLALLDITFMQRILARPDLKMEFFHLMSFLLSHCTSKWKVATDQVGLLLLESLLLLGYFALLHPQNQAVLRWGKSPTILHKVCDLPFVFFSDPELVPILAATLVAACYGCEQNKGVVQQELSTDMMLSLLKSCRNALLEGQSSLSFADNPTEGACECNQSFFETRKVQNDALAKPSRYNLRSSRLPLGKGVPLVNTRSGKLRNQREGKVTKTCEEWALKHNLPASDTSFTFMLHYRIPVSFIDKAEEFFSAEIPCIGDEV